MIYPDMTGNNLTLDASYWKKAAQRVIRNYCGWHVAPSTTETIKVDAYSGQTLTLPSKHVTSITSILINNEEKLQDATWSTAGTIQFSSNCLPDAPGSVQVTLTHGYEPEEVPELIELIRVIAARAAQHQSGIASQSVNGSSISYQTYGGTTLGLQLLAIEKDMLNPYKLNWSLK